MYLIAKSIAYFHEISRTRSHRQPLDVSLEAALVVPQQEGQVVRRGGVLSEELPQGLALVWTGRGKDRLVLIEVLIEVIPQS